MAILTFWHRGVNIILLCGAAACGIMKESRRCITEQQARGHAPACSRDERTHHEHSRRHRRRSLRHHGRAHRRGKPGQPRHPAGTAAAHRPQAPGHRQRPLQPDEHRRDANKLPRGAERLRRGRARALFAAGYAGLFPRAWASDCGGVRRAGLPALQLRKLRAGRAALCAGKIRRGAALRLPGPADPAAGRGLRRRHRRVRHRGGFPHRRLRRGRRGKARRRDGRL